MVEKAVEIHGQAPDLETLRKILSGPLPSVRWGGYSHEIGYLQTGEKTYQLNYVDPSMFFGDIVIYDSATPKKVGSEFPFEDNTELVRPSAGCLSSLGWASRNSIICFQQS